MAHHVGRRLGRVDDATFMRLVSGLENIPDLVEQCLESAPAIEEIAKLFADADNALYLGRGYQFPVALEGALKLKKSATSTPRVTRSRDETRPHRVDRRGNACHFHRHPRRGVRESGEQHPGGESPGAKSWPSSQKETAKSSPWRTTPLKFLVRMRRLRPVDFHPMQLLSYHIALLRGCNVDQPRNLAKSVTVE